MCGISFLVNNGSIPFEKFIGCIAGNNNRGPDTTVCKKITNNAYGIFHRLSIINPGPDGEQPFTCIKGKYQLTLFCNGEIYNYKELLREICDRSYYKESINVNVGSDCEIILKWITSMMDDTNPDKFMEVCKKLDGEFAMVLHLKNNLDGSESVYYATDPYGVRPLFVLDSDSGVVSIGSEIKNLYIPENTQYTIRRVLPGTINLVGGKTTSYYDCNSIKIHENNLKLDIYLKNIRNSLTRAVIKRLESDRPIGFLLSGGLDSSLVCAIAQNHLNKSNKKINTFSIGMPGGTDETYARMVAEYIGSNHKHIKVSKEDFLSVIEDTIIACETYDTTTVRASTGQYLISKWIKKNTDIKVLYIGDGSDELTSGYIYFHKAPSPEESDLENRRLLKNIHLYDGLRADRCISNNGLEARVPFLDIEFCETYLSVPAKYRVPIDGYEKWLLRMSFDGTGLLPDKVLYRRKEAFSDGISSTENSWHSILKDYVSKQDFELCEIEHCKPYDTESRYYRYLFNKYYNPNKNGVDRVIPEYWMPKWVGVVNDPSARILSNYK